MAVPAGPAAPLTEACAFGPRPAGPACSLPPPTTRSDAVRSGTGVTWHSSSRNSPFSNCRCHTLLPNRSRIDVPRSPGSRVPGTSAATSPSSRPRLLDPGADAVSEADARPVEDQHHGEEGKRRRKEHRPGRLHVGRLKAQVVDEKAQVHELALKVYEGKEAVHRQLGSELDDAGHHQRRHFAGG